MSAKSVHPSTPLTIGFVGLGVMGVPMARHLGQAGHRVQGFDVAPVALERLQAAHGSATPCSSARQAAHGADVVFTMLPNGRVVRDTVLAADGIAAGLRAGAVLVDTSSSEPWLTRETAAALAARGASMVDAPVSGAQWGAEAADLVFMVGGADADVQRVRPLLDVMGKQIFHLGPLGAGHTMKCLNNLVTAMTLTATAEVLATGTRCGLDPAVMTDVLNASTGGSWITRTHIHQRVISRRFDDPFKLELMLKDIGIALGVAREAGVDMPLCEAGHPLWQEADRAQGPGVSVSELVRWIEQREGVTITSGRHPMDTGPGAA
ncbi:MAG TPA: NAD(P)-dependent oxidoreductase [Burkholderiaceae bacterium]|nr:NAD(P)-dependent oxidoreductase [Burkholderiaceae bacterium]